MKRLLLASLVLSALTGCEAFKVNSWYEGYNAHYAKPASGDSLGFDGDPDRMTQTAAGPLRNADPKVATADETCDMACCKDKDAKK